MNRSKRIGITSLHAATLLALGLFPWITLAERSDQDLLRDKLSKPQEVMAFVGVEHGWQVMDLFSGNGYYAEILSDNVGTTGKVYLHNNRAYLQFANKLQERVKDNRLPNVEVYTREIEDIMLARESIDLVMMVMTYHDAYFQQNGWTVTPGPLFRTIHRILKPGGLLVVIDHHATSGSGPHRAQDLHRIEAAFAKQDISARGFEFIAASNILENDIDTLTRSVFDPMIRGNTSRFLFKFKKVKKSFD
ncbi:MAG: methyltransferase domain-containing protein [Pseudomonadota bacterium]